jgi:hypothetical protein
MDREKDYFRYASRIAQLSGDIDSANRAHGNIEQDEIGSESLVLADHDSRVGYGGDHSVTSLFFQHFANMINDVNIVIGQEHGYTRHRPASQLLVPWRYPRPGFDDVTWWDSHNRMLTVTRADIMQIRRRRILSELTMESSAFEQLIGSRILRFAGNHLFGSRNMAFHLRA